jgi:hypothetical protein
VVAGWWVRRFQAQHKRELDVRDGLTAPSEGSAGAGVGTVAVTPPPMQHMHMQVPVPSLPSLPAFPAAWIALGRHACMCVCVWRRGARADVSGPSHAHAGVRESNEERGSLGGRVTAWSSAPGLCRAQSCSHRGQAFIY